MKSFAGSHAYVLSGAFFYKMRENGKSGCWDEIIKKPEGSSFGISHRKIFIYNYLLFRQILKGAW